LSFKKEAFIEMWREGKMTKETYWMTRMRGKGLWCFKPFSTEKRRGDKEAAVRHGDLWFG